MLQTEKVLEVEYELMITFCTSVCHFLHLILVSTFHCPLLRETVKFLCVRPPFKINFSCRGYRCSLLQGKEFVHHFQC